MSDVISVLTSNSVETILADGGSQSWVLDRTRAARCDYIVMCRNIPKRAEDDENHGAAFMIGRIKDVVPSTEDPGRWLVLISDYTLIDIKDQWSGRNPVSYWKDSDFTDIDFKALDFMPLMPQAAKGLTIAEAKAGLALAFNVPEIAVEITIRG